MLILSCANLYAQATTLVDRVIPAGAHAALFDGSAYSSGVYFVNLKNSQASSTQKIILLK
jgi:hypothetical protein